MAGQIDIIVAKKAIEELNKAVKGVDAINNSIVTLSKSVRELNTTFSQIKTPKGLEDRLKKNEKAQKELNIETKESERLNKALIISREKLKTVTSAENIELQKNRQRLNESNRAIRTLDSAYAKLSKRTLDAKKRAKDLGAQYGLTSKQFKKAQKEARKLDGRIKKLDKAVGDSQRNVGNYPKVFGSATSAMKGFIGAFGIIEGLRLGFRFIKDLTTLAKQMEGDSRRAAIVFGESLGFVTKQAEENAIALGLTRKEYVAAAAATQDLLIPLGFQRKEASRLSVELTNLSGVLSNWVGGQKDAREVSEILTKSILGETEQIKTLGIKIDQSTPAFNRRVKNLEETNNLTREQAKALEILNQIISKSTDAQTEFANATKSLSLQEAEANALYREQSEILAEDIIPAYITWLNVKRGFIKGFGDFSLVLQSELSFFEKFNALTGLGIIIGADSAAVIADRVREERKLAKEEKERTDKLEKAIRVTQIYNKENKITITDEELRTRFSKKTTEQLQKQIDVIERLNKINEDSNKVVDSSIKALEKIIAKNIELIKTTTDDTYRRRLLQENQLLAQQIKLLLKVPEAVKAINVVSVSAAPQVGGTTAERAEGEVLDLPFKFQDFSTDVLEDITDFVDEYGDQIGQAIDITNAFFDNRLERIQQDIDANNEFFANQIALAEGNEAEQVRLEAERQRRDAELRKKQSEEARKQFIIKQGVALSTIAINTAVAISEASPNVIKIIAAALLGATQLAAVASTPVPKFAEGTESAPKGLAVVGDAGVHEYIETPQGIFKTPDTDTLVQFKGKEKIHKDLDSLAISKGYDLEAINKAAVMTSIFNDGVKLNSIQLANVFNDTLKKFNSKIESKIERGIKRGFKGVSIHNNTNFDHSIYKNEVL